jgi:hypothetical protein
LTVAALVCTADHGRLAQLGALGMAQQLLLRGQGQHWAADMLVSILFVCYSASLGLLPRGLLLVMLEIMPRA